MQPRGPAHAPASRVAARHEAAQEASGAYEAQLQDLLFDSALEGLTDPEAKRRAIGDTFIRVFEREAARLGLGEMLLGQGTIYPDTIETGGTKRADVNWRGRPLTDFRTVVKLITSTKTKSGLTVKVRLDRKSYQRGIKVSPEEMQKIALRQHAFHGEWNYTSKPS